MQYSGGVTNEEYINKKWRTLLSVLKIRWEHGDNDIYCMIRLHPEPEFCLCNDQLKTQPLDKEIKDKQLMMFRMVEVDELDELLNKKYYVYLFNYLFYFIYTYIYIFTFKQLNNTIII